MNFRPFFTVLSLPAIVLLMNACRSEGFKEEVQITHGATYNHNLDNNDNFSPDDRWLVYDVRTDEGGIGGCPRIEKVNVKTGEIVELYEIKDNNPWGPGVGAASYSHTEHKVAFIHGLKNVTPENPYQQWRRSGVIVEDAQPGVAVFMDARDVTYPFTPGALRGGTHRHEWSGDGGWIGYTYNDAIMKHLEDSTGQVHNLRTIGVSKKGRKVMVDNDPAGENINGEWFSVLVVKVTPDPQSGTDEISHAASDSWVGRYGYKKQDGTMQRARAFLGKIKDKNGTDVEEVFIVDIPEDITTPGPDGPLEGTRTTMPAPPKGAVQRRLTFTAGTTHPGCSGTIRSSSDGSLIAFKAYDKKGILQVFTISPIGGEPVQQTFHDTDVQGNVRWHPEKHRICYVWDNSIIVRDIGSKDFSRITKRTDDIPGNLVWSHDGKTIAYNRDIPTGRGKKIKQIFIVGL